MSAAPGLPCRPSSPPRSPSWRRGTNEQRLAAFDELVKAHATAARGDVEALRRPGEESSRPSSSRRRCSRRWRLPAAASQPAAAVNSGAINASRDKDAARAARGWSRLDGGLRTMRRTATTPALAQASWRGTSTRTTCSATLELPAAPDYPGRQRGRGRDDDLPRGLTGQAQEGPPRPGRDDRQDRCRLGRLRQCPQGPAGRPQRPDRHARAARACWSSASRPRRAPRVTPLPRTSSRTATSSATRASRGATRSTSG